MKTLILIILLTLSANADFWSKMIKGPKGNNSVVSQQSVSITEIDVNGIKAGYIDYYQGVDNYVPIRNPFYDGYAIGAMRAKKDIESRNNFDGGITDYYNQHKYNNQYYNRNDNYQERSNFHIPVKVKSVNDNDINYYDTDVRFYDH